MIWYQPATNHCMTHCHTVWQFCNAFWTYSLGSICISVTVWPSKWRGGIRSLFLNELNKYHPNTELKKRHVLECSGHRCRIWVPFRIHYTLSKWLKSNKCAYCMGYTVIINSGQPSDICTCASKITDIGPKVAFHPFVANSLSAQILVKC